MAEANKKSPLIPLLILFGLVAALFLFIPWGEEEEESGGEKYDHDMDTEPYSQGILDTELDYSIDDFIQKAEILEGTDYQSGGDNPEEGFNSSGFVQHVYENATGIRMPRLAAHQLDLGEDVGRNYLQTGDVVFFESETLMSGIYLEENEFMTVTESGGVERLHLDDDDFWSRNYIGARRLTEEEIESLHPGTYSDHDHPAVREAMNYLSTPYEFGGDTLEAFDCSFFIQEVFRDSKNVFLPRVTLDQFEVGEDIPEENLREGDVLYFSDVDVEDSLREEGEVTHAGIYVGDGFMIHASRTEGMTQISKLNDYWSDAFTGVKRFDDMALEGENPVVERASAYLNVPFKSGGENPDSGFNTSGFVRHVFSEARDVDLPRNGRAMWNNGEEVPREELQPGDLVFFDGSQSLLPGIYVGNNQFMITSESSGVTTRHLDDSDFFADLYEGARRY
ncbi:C40 family peptidase [Alkalicoccus halolimnae]|uniref:C40 family peptidase n=1 Tax=Alkalicoccus halolimnae TaxID=1667239 RepID=A0A5C7FH08_9BACI|nr:C40 family peptidase [Alkalicoccus halolimnae]TXF85564.1 hypothetical protein FTX54_08210 [Alkalicoccus halolimnae]